VYSKPGQPAIIWSMLHISLGWSGHSPMGRGSLIEHHFALLYWHSWQRRLAACEISRDAQVLLGHALYCSKVHVAKADMPIIQAELSCSKVGLFIGSCAEG